MSVTFLNSPYNIPFKVIFSSFFEQNWQIFFFLAPSFVLRVNQIFVRNIVCWPCPAPFIIDAEGRQELDGMSVKANLPSQVIGLMA